MTSWRCTCGQTNKLSATYCPGCGGHWAKCQQTSWQRPQQPANSSRGAAWDTGWQEDAWQPKSPRQRPRSPRKRTPGGKDKGKGKGKQDGGKAEGPKGPASAAAPSTSQLPKPPKAKLIAPPREAASASAPTEDRKALDSLLDKLQQQDELPEEIRQMMSQLAVSSAKTEAKALHKLVAQRQEASAALERVRTERLSFEAGWASYTQALVDLLQKQLGEREATLKDLDESQEAWLQRLTEATSALKQATRTGPVIDLDNEDEDAMEAEIDQAAQDSAKMEVRQQRLTAQHQQMLQLLTSVRDEATATAAPEKREGSRTPRRRSKDAADQGMAAPPTEAVKLEPATQGVIAGKTRTAAGGDGQQPGTGAHF